MLEKVSVGCGRRSERRLDLDNGNRGGERTWEIWDRCGTADIGARVKIMVEGSRTMGHDVE